MPDIPGNSSTTSTTFVGGSASDVLEVNGDHDWFRIELVAGQKITITLNGITLEDPYLRVYDAGDNLLAENDDVSSGMVLDSRIVFTAPYSGTFYLDVGAYAEGHSGAYQLNVAPYTPPPVATLGTIATHLTHDFWGGDSHHFNATQGGTITVNLTALTTAGRSLAREALGLWSDVIGISFSEVSNGGQITFDDNESGAFSDGIWSNGIISSSHVNVSTQWLASNGSSLDSYSFQTYIHEIGHALGLGHGGHYNSTATYANDALFANDGWPSTIMSYFDQNESVYFNDLGFSNATVVTPMLADIRAMGTLYGLSTATRTGDTTYGFNNNSGRSVYSAAVGNTITALTIIDSGGIDTLDYSGFSSSQIINLNPETFSNIGGGVGNVAIGFGTVIENALGGSGNDTLIGNSANNLLNGGSGSDLVSYVTANAGVTVNMTLVGSQNTVGAGSDQLVSIEALIGSNFADVLTASNQTVFIRGGSGNDTLTPASDGDTLYGEAGDDWFISGPGFDTFDGGAGFDTVDFSGAGAAVDTRHGQGGADGVDTYTDIERLIGSNYDDILELQGNTVIMGGAGNDTLFASLAASTLTGGSGNDTFYGTATYLATDTITDFALGDRIVISDATLAGFAFNLSGSTLTFTGGSLTLTGGVSGQLVASAAAGGGVQLTIQAIVPVINDVRNDFNGDGRSDVLWRSDGGALSNWLGTASGGFVTNDANAFTVVPTSWQVAGTGDFNGDGRDDILWRNSNGQLSDWLGTANGGFVTNDANALTSAPTNWHVVGTGDFNGDGRDDILWRSDAGQLSNWLGQANGGFVGNDANAFTNAAPTNWHVAGTGDFNGDGRDDILWRSDSGQLSNWLGTASGGFTPNDANAFTSVATNWHVAGTGDFNGDGRDDILWRSDAGQLSNWLGQANGGFVTNDANAFTTVGTNWQIDAIGDYNGDGRDDILWRSDSGGLSNWLGTATGGFTNNDPNAAATVPTNWHVQPEAFIL